MYKLNDAGVMSVLRQFSEAFLELQETTKGWYNGQSMEHSAGENDRFHSSRKISCSPVLIIDMRGEATPYRWEF